VRITARGRKFLTDLAGGDRLAQSLQETETSAVFLGRPELTSDVQRRTDIAMTYEAGRT
jgi:hypothetical protein